MHTEQSRKNSTPTPFLSRWTNFLTSAQTHGQKWLLARRYICIYRF